MIWPFKRKTPNPSASPSPEPPAPEQREGDWGPMDRLFAAYVLDVIGHLAPEREQGVASMAPKLQAALHTTAADWRGIVTEALQLSETIDVAILDLWYRNGESSAAAGHPLTPEAYAYHFVEEYSRDGSQVDVWPGDALEQAKARIAARRQ